MREQALTVCGARSATEIGDFSATSLSTLTQMVAGGDMLTILPELALSVESRGRRDLATRPFHAPVPHRTIALAWRRTSARADEFRELAASLVP